MAILYVTEFTNLGAAGVLTAQLPLAAPATPPVAEQHVAIGGSSTQSAAVDPNTAFIMVNTDAACCLAFGTDPTAVNTAHRLGTNETRFYGVPIGKKFKIAVIVAV